METRRRACGILQVTRQSIYHPYFITLYEMNLLNTKIVFVLNVCYSRCIRLLWLGNILNNDSPTFKWTMTTKCDRLIPSLLFKFTLPYIFDQYNMIIEVENISARHSHLDSVSTRCLEDRPPSFYHPGNKYYRRMCCELNSTYCIIYVRQMLTYQQVNNSIH